MAPGTPAQVTPVNEEYEPLDPWDPWQQGEQGPVEAPLLEVYVSDPPDPVGVILGPDGEPLHTVYDREPVPFGFHP